MQSNYRIGDPVIFRVSKLSTNPGPRAEAIAPAPRGEFYSYEVDKYWVVAEARPDGKVLLRTRRGKERVLDAGNPRLRRAHWWERLLYRRRFPRLTEPQPQAED